MGFLDVELLPFQARFTQHFSEIVVEVKASGPPQILKVLRISKGMLPVRYFHSIKSSILCQ